MQQNQMERYITLGKNIAYFRKARKYTQENLAEKVNISRTHVGRIEIADCAVSLDILYEIADALEIEPYLLFQSENDRQSLERITAGRAFARRANLDMANTTDAEFALLSDIAEGVLRYLREK